MKDIPLQVLTKRLFKLNLSLNQSLTESKKIAERIKLKYDPRHEFECWRNSKEGEIWKQQQYKIQNGCCAICRQPTPFKGSHIDHIKPISLYPDLNIDPKNLQITCPPCNISKSNKVDDLS